MINQLTIINSVALWVKPTTLGHFTLPLDLALSGQVLNNQCLLTYSACASMTFIQFNLTFDPYSLFVNQSRWHCLGHELGFQPRVDRVLLKVPP